LPPHLSRLAARVPSTSSRAFLFFFPLSSVSPRVSGRARGCKRHESAYARAEAGTMISDCYYRSTNRPLLGSPTTYIYIYTRLLHTQKRRKKKKKRKTMHSRCITRRIYLKGGKENGVDTAGCVTVTASYSLHEQRKDLSRERAISLAIKDSCGICKLSSTCN